MATMIVIRSWAKEACKHCFSTLEMKKTRSETRETSTHWLTIRCRKKALPIFVDLF